MHNGEVEDLEGALTGALIALGANWVRSDNHRLRMINQAKLDATTAMHLIRDLASSGYFQRIERPIVADALGGLLLAEQVRNHPGLQPSLRQLGRLNLAEKMKAHLQHLRWPPREGQYDAQGMVIKAGDLSTLFLGLVYAESQAWNLGLLQEEEPTQDQRTQIYYAAQALTQVLYETGLTLAQFVAAWKSLFLGSLAATPGGGSAPPDPHAATAPSSGGGPSFGPPTISAQNVGLVSVQALGSEVLGNAYSYVSQNSDRANKWRITAGGGGVGVGTVLFQVNYGSPWTLNGKPYVPVVAAQGLAFSAVNLSPTSFQVATSIALAPNSVTDVGFAVVGA